MYYLSRRKYQSKSLDNTARTLNFSINTAIEYYGINCHPNDPSFFCIEFSQGENRNFNIPIYGDDGLRNCQEIECKGRFIIEEVNTFMHPTLSKGVNPVNAWCHLRKWKTWNCLLFCFIIFCPNLRSKSWSWVFLFTSKSRVNDVTRPMIRKSCCVIGFLQDVSVILYQRSFWRKNVAIWWNSVEQKKQNIPKRIKKKILTVKVKSLKNVYCHNDINADYTVWTYAIHFLEYKRRFSCQSK